MLGSLKKFLGINQTTESIEKEKYKGIWQEILTIDDSKLLSKKNKPDIPPQIEIVNGRINSIDISSIPYFDPFSQPRALWFPDIEKVVFKVVKDLNKYVDLKKVAEIVYRTSFLQKAFVSFYFGSVFAEKHFFDDNFHYYAKEFREQTTLITRSEYQARESNIEEEWQDFKVFKQATTFLTEGKYLEDEDLPSLEEYKEQELGQYKRFKEDSQFFKIYADLLFEVRAELYEKLNKEYEDLWSKLQYIPLLDIYIKKESAEKLGIDPHIEVYLRMLHNTERFNAYAPENIGFEHQTITFNQFSPALFEFVIDVRFKEDNDIKKAFDYIVNEFLTSPSPYRVRSLATYEFGNQLIIPHVFFISPLGGQRYKTDYNFLGNLYYIFSYPSILKPDNLVRLDPDRINFSLANFLYSKVFSRIGRKGKKQEGSYMEEVYEAIKGKLLIPTYKKTYTVRDYTTDSIKEITDENVIDSLYHYMYYYLIAAHDYFLDPKRYPKEHEEYFKVYKDFFKTFPSFDKLYDEFLDAVTKYYGFYDNTFAKVGELLLVIVSFIYPAMAHLINSYQVLAYDFYTDRPVPSYNLLSVFSELVLLSYVDVHYEKLSILAYEDTSFLNNLIDRSYTSLEEVLPFIRGIEMEYKEEEPVTEEIIKEV
jgi:hypothetical protein